MLLQLVPVISYRLQIIDLEMGFVRETLNWKNETKPGPFVQAIGTSPEFLFICFESRDGNHDSTIPSTNLSWVSSLDLLMVSRFPETSRISLWKSKKMSIAFWILRFFDTLSAVFNISSDGSWSCLGDSRKVMNVIQEGFGSKNGELKNLLYSHLFHVDLCLLHLDSCFQSIAQMMFGDASNQSPNQLGFMGGLRPSAAVQ
ncbi:hypothetical protein OSB04_026344, partial [Centaurea solstitialis]